MPDPKILVDAGGWAAFATLALFVIAAFVRGDIVAGRTYQRQEKRADTMTEQTSRTAGLLERVLGLLEGGRGRGRDANG